MRRHDVPRPKDDSEACVRRLARGDNHALVDLAYALEREGDPRSKLLDERFRGFAEWSSSLPAGCLDPNEVVAYWQATALFALRLMTPVGLSVAEFVDRERRAV